MILSTEQNVNLKLKGTIKEMHLRLREKDELVRLLRLTIENRENKIEEIKSELEGVMRKNKNMKLQVENMKKTLESFNIIGVVEEGSEYLNQKNKFVTALRNTTTSKYITSFLLPREITELGFTSKIVFSLLRNSPALIQNISANTMFDKHNIKYTIVRGNFFFNFFKEIFYQNFFRSC